MCWIGLDLDLVYSWCFTVVGCLLCLFCGYGLCLWSAGLNLGVWVYCCLIFDLADLVECCLFGCFGCFLGCWGGLWLLMIGLFVLFAGLLNYVWLCWLVECVDLLFYGLIVL